MSNVTVQLAPPPFSISAPHTPIQNNLMRSHKWQVLVVVVIFIGVWLLVPSQDQIDSGNNITPHHLLPTGNKVDESSPVDASIITKEEEGKGVPPLPPTTTDAALPWIPSPTALPSRAQVDKVESIASLWSWDQVCSKEGVVELTRRNWQDTAPGRKEGAATVPIGGGEEGGYTCRCLGGYRSGQDHWKTFFYWAMTWLCKGVNPQDAGKGGRRLRVVQVGANSGDNANDPLYELLRRHDGLLARSALLEPVPWVFNSLVKTYSGVDSTTTITSTAANNSNNAVVGGGGADKSKRTRNMYRRERVTQNLVQQGIVTPMRNAMSNTEGGISFMAPKPATETLQGRSASSIKNWMAQVGGINIAKKVEKHVAKEKLSSFIGRIEVEAIRFETVLRRMRWVSSDDTARNLLPDIFVVDSEGHDDVILNVVLDDIARHYGPSARIPLMLYEFKHFTEERHFGMLKRLAGLEYCLSVVGEDVVAVHMSVEQLKPQCTTVNL